MAKTPATFDETTHYNGEATAKFYPGAHFYSVTDTHKGDPSYVYTNRRMGGGTSVTGVMNKGQALMMWPMYEMKKYLKLWAKTHTFEEIMSSPLSWDDILKEGTLAHSKKSDRGKSVGTDAHQWVEYYLRELMRIQNLLGVTDPTTDPVLRSKMADEFKLPVIPEVEEITAVLRRSYLALFNASKPHNFDEYKQLARQLVNNAEVEEAIWTEATMLQRSILAAQEWLSKHYVHVHGTEDTVYSRILQICGKYDGDITVECSDLCNWCYRNGDATLPNDNFMGRYIYDFKSTNVSEHAPKGIYPEYLCQTGVYDVAKTEEFPDIEYDGHLILNGSKNPVEKPDGTPLLSKKTGEPLQPFNTHFSFRREFNRNWAIRCAGVREDIYKATKEVERSA